MLISIKLIFIAVLLLLTTICIFLSFEATRFKAIFEQLHDELLAQSLVEPTSIISLVGIFLGFFLAVKKPKAALWISLFKFFGPRKYKALFAPVETIIRALMELKSKIQNH